MQTILVIDDDAMVRDAMVRLLQFRGYNVAAAQNGVEGVAAFISEEPDLVITDILMPEKDGLETIDEMRHLRPDAKIIAISGGGRAMPDDLLKMAQDLGAADALTKPIDAEQFLRRVALCLPPP